MAQLHPCESVQKAKSRPRTVASRSECEDSEEKSDEDEEDEGIDDEEALVVRETGAIGSPRSNNEEEPSPSFLRGPRGTRARGIVRSPVHAPVRGLLVY
ncbi:hypothetical protein KM043_008794 [Ampulex compressa]|nr:hypothetical protein KM043_008794 [Ampulex compressa]